MKKQALTKQEQYNKQHAENRLKRRQAELAKKSAEEEKRSELYFRRKVRGASDKKAPMTLRTKSYYRFSGEYPGNVDTNGFRENRPARKKLSVGKKFAVFLICAIVFALSYVGARTGTLFSMKEGEKSAAVSEGAAQEKALRFLHISDAALKKQDIGMLKTLITECGCNAALFELKAENGEVYFEENAAAPPETTEDAAAEVPGETTQAPRKDARWDAVAGLEAAGIRTAAYISCYKDNAAVSREPSLAVADYDDPLTPLKDNDGNSWLDPFSPAVSDYLLSLVRRASVGGFSYIVLDNICRPTRLGLKTALYPTTGDTGENINSALKLFILNACNEAGKEKIVVLCDPYGFTSPAEDISGRYGGELLTSGAVNFAVDARLSFAQADSDPDGIYRYIKEMPTVSVLDSVSAASGAVKEAGGAEGAEARKLWACAETGENDEELRTILNGSQAEAFILW